jgi:4-diphosphocytidyl-2-C-methyl-D-erythritol kinase
MDKIDLVAHAKVNLTLDVLGKREDGYHEVEMIMQTIDLHDRISFTKIDTGIEIISNHPEVPIDKSNLIYKVAEMLFEEFELTGGLRVNLDKRIPVAAGLAGGSSNAAATLVAINRLWNLGLTSEQLAKIGGKLGADIPFCIEGGTQLATGIGTDLKELPKCPQLYLVLINPPFSVSTAKVYGNLNLDQVAKHPSTDKVIKALQEQDREVIINNLDNLLENVTLKFYPEVANLKDKVAELADKALMSGSGPTILGFVSGIKEAEKIKNKLEKELTREHKIVVAKTVNHGITEI